MAFICTKKLQIKQDYNFFKLFIKRIDLQAKRVLQAIQENGSDLSDLSDEEDKDVSFKPCSSPSSKDESGDSNDEPFFGKYNFDPPVEEFNEEQDDDIEMRSS